MSAAELWGFVREHGVKWGEVVLATLGIILLFLEVALIRDTLQKPRAHWTYGDVLMPFVNFGLSAAFLFAAWMLPRERYLLREGASRYTVAWVYKYGRQRGFDTFLYRYRVAGYDGQGYLRCGVSYGRALPCPPLGTRFYVQFSPEDPGVEQITQLEVPDSVRVIPPLGWARLPE